MKRNLFLAAAAGVIAACNGATGPAGGDYESIIADKVMFGMHTNLTNAGVRSATLKADTALMFDDSATVKLRRVQLELFTETGVVRAELTSVSGELDERTNKMVARGDVVLIVKGENAQTIRTEELHYDPNLQEIWSDVFTERVMADGRRNTMHSFRANDRLGNFSAKGLEGDAGQIRF